jgi:hypothetical protein
LSYADAVVEAVGVESGPKVVDCPTGAGKTRAIQPLAMAPHSTTD